MSIVMPLIYARTYGVGVRIGVPGINFLICAAATAFCGVLNHVGTTEKQYDGPPSE